MNRFRKLAKKIKLEQKASLGQVSYPALKGGASGVKEGFSPFPLICRFKAKLPIPCLSLRHGYICCKQARISGI
jgi:hypothetical protein